jgi:adenine-specific DNA-methyltransferase
MLPLGARRAVLGQIFTPAPVADLAIALALEKRGAGARVLDPACGDGVFLARATARGAHAFGVEIDPRTALAARSHPSAAVKVADFLTLAPPARLFDAVIGNPPYVRQETLGIAKGRIAARIAADWPDGPAVVWSGRADLAAAFVARALRFVRPGGRVAFVVSAALLEAGYHDVLRDFLAGRGRIAAVVASPRERWFHDAAVHGVLLVLERDPAPRPTICARLRVPIGEAARRVGGLGDLAAVADVRLAQPGEPLAPLLRAPDVWLAAAAEVPLVPLGTLAEVRRGVTSGANSFFYLPRAAAARAGPEPALL